MRASVLLVGDDTTAKDKPPPSRPGWYMKDGKQVHASTLYVYIHTHTYIHTYIHTYTYRPSSTDQTDLLPTQVKQDMNWTNPRGEVVRRGMQSLAQERGIDVKGLGRSCVKCTQERSRGFTGEADLERNNCCLRRVFENQPDFMAQKNQIQEVRTTHSHWYVSCTHTTPPIII